MTSETKITVSETEIVISVTISIEIGYFLSFKIRQYSELPNTLRGEATNAASVKVAI